MDSKVFYDLHTNKSVKVVCLNEGMTIDEALNKTGVVYVQVPDNPLKNGLIKVNIGHTLGDFVGRQIGHFLSESKTSCEISQDIDETLYFKLVSDGITDREQGRRVESLMTAQCAYDMCSFANKQYCDIIRLITFDKSLAGKMYNKRLEQTHKGKAIISVRDYNDIISGKYSILDELELDLMRVGAISHKIAM